MTERRAEKRTRGAEHRRRLANHLVELAWLEGFPVVDGWYRLDRDETIAVDGARIARARRAARTALREHREALGDAVGDVDRWWAAVDAALAWCSAPHGELDLIDHAPRRIAKQARAAAARPEIRAAVIAAGVAWATRPEQLGPVVTWLAAHGAIVEDVATTLVLARLAADVPDGVAALVELLATDAPEPTTARQHVHDLCVRLRGNQAKSTSPGPRSSHHVRTWLAELRRRPRELQHRALALLAVSRLAEVLAPWCTWERANAERVARAEAFVARDFHRDTLGYNQERLLDIVEAIVRDVPTESPAIEKVLGEIDELAGDPQRDVHAAALSLLRCVAGEPHTAVRMVKHVVAVVRRASHTRTLWLWHALAAAHDAGASPRLLELWRTSVRSSRYIYLDDGLVEALPRRADVERLVAVLVALAALGPLSQLDAERAADWIAIGVAPDAAAELVVALRPLDRHGRFWDATCRAAVALSDGTPRDIAAQAAPLIEVVGKLEYHDRQALLQLVEVAARGGARWLLRAAYAAKLTQPLVDAAQLLRAAPRITWPAIPPTPPAWITRYPAALAPALAELAAVDPDAEHGAARRLASDLPDPAALRREISALRERAPLTAAQAKRLANLERRLAAPRRPSAVRLAHLAEKLSRAAVTIGVARISAQIAVAASERLARCFPHGGWPALDDRLTRDVVFGLLALREQDRALAARLLQKRSGPRPWDLRDDPANATFLAAMCTAGVDPAPWLDDAPRVVPGHDGAAVELALCGDPIEVFAMGAHFETCLAPRGINYFSVIANAADINKRVLYARRGGRVVGRCLLAVTDRFALLAFNPYCHDTAVGFAELVRGFVDDLAARMRSRVAARGAVRLLVARDWYDDGPVDLVGRFAGFDGATLGLDYIAPGALVERLRAALDHDLDDVTLPLVLALPALRARPALLAPLLPYIAAARAPAIHLTAARLAAGAGELALADRLLGDHAAEIALEDGEWALTHLVAELRPSHTLARLRGSRPHGIRTWRDEHSERAALAAIALEALNRPRQALELYERVAADHRDLGEVMRPRLDALRARLARP